VGTSSQPEFVPTLTGDGDSDIRGTAPAPTAASAPAPDASGGDRAALAPDGANRAAGVPNSQTPQPTVAERIANRAGTNDTAPLGDPNAPQGTGREQNTADPANRLAPAGKIRFADADPRSKE
jgi:hypothetical protein